MRAGEGVDENSSDGLGEHARKTRSFSLRPLRRKKKKTKRKRERFFDLEFFEKRFSDPREKNGVYFRRVSPNTSRHPSDDLVRRFSPHGSEAARDTETLLLSFFRPNIDFFPSIDPFALIYLIFVFLSLSFRPLHPPITRAVVNPFAQSNRKWWTARPGPADPFSFDLSVSRDLKETSTRFHSKSRNKERKLEADSAVRSSRARLWLLPFFAVSPLFSFSFLFSLSLETRRRKEDGRAAATTTQTYAASFEQLPRHAPPPSSPTISRWPRMAGDRSRQKPRTSCDCRPRSQRRLCSRPRPDARPSPSILPFSFISLLPSLLCFSPWNFSRFFLFYRFYYKFFFLFRSLLQTELSVCVIF